MQTINVGNIHQFLKAAAPGLVKQWELALEARADKIGLWIVLAAPLVLGALVMAGAVSYAVAGVVLVTWLVFGITASKIIKAAVVASVTASAKLAIAWKLTAVGCVVAAMVWANMHDIVLWTWLISAIVAMLLVDRCFSHVAASVMEETVTRVETTEVPNGSDA